MKDKSKSTAQKGNSVAGAPAPQVPDHAAENKANAGPTPEIIAPGSAVTAVEDTPTTIDLSGLDIKKTGSNTKTLVVEISASEGTLTAIPDDNIEVVQADDGTIQLIGRRTDIEKYLKNLEAFTYTGEEDDFGEDAATLSVSVMVEGTGEIDAEAEIGIDITDTRDDLIGTPQKDTLVGDDGMNLIRGLGSDDYLIGNGGIDEIYGEAGNDTIRGGEGADSLDGGEGFDVLQYTDSAGGVIVDLRDDGTGAQSASGGDAEGDVITGFEHVYGSDSADTITGNDERNILFGYAGDDVLIGLGGDDVIRGGLGADTMEGGDGIDWLRYVEAASGVTINLNADDAGLQGASGGEAEGDVISGFENIQGSDHADSLTGNADANYIIGNDGDDEIMAGGGNDTVRGGLGADTLVGGDGKDTLQYMDSSAGVTVSLAADSEGLQSASGGEAEGDVISGFENVHGSDFGDILTGDDVRNILYGYDGEDILDGGLDDDVLRGGADADEFRFTTALMDGENVDRILDFETGLDTLVLDSAVFSALTAGALGALAFHVNDTGLAETADHHVIYDSGTGVLYYDGDGTGEAEGVAFAHLWSLPTIVADDFMII